MRYFSVGAETVLEDIDAGLDDGHLYLVDGVRSERQTIGNLLDRTGGDQFVILADRHLQPELVCLTVVHKGIAGRFAYSS